MLSKLKSKKPPISLNNVTNALKSSGGSLTPSELTGKDLAALVSNTIGIGPDSVVAAAYDPVQSLLALSTSDKEVRVYGQNGVEVVFEFRLSSPLTHLRFVKGVYLVGVSGTPANVTVISLHSKSILGTFSPSGSVAAVETDSSLDWLILGMANGGILFYDIDRLSAAPLRVDNLQKRVLPKQKLSAVCNIEWHPRDLGTILVSYSHCAVLYSLITGEVKNAFVYQLTKEMRGFASSLAHVSSGKRKMFGSPKEIFPAVLEAHFHPNGLHIVTIHEDNSIVFWDVASATLIEARNLTEIGLTSTEPPLEPSPGFHQIQKVKWVCSSDPEFTQLLVCGGDESNPESITVLDFGMTLKYSLASYEKQTEFYRNPQNGVRRINYTLHRNTPRDDFIVQMLPLPSKLPYFNGNHDPSQILLLSNHGSIYFLDLLQPDESKIDISGLILPTSVSLVSPPLAEAYIESVPRVDWFSIISHRATTGASSSIKPILNGGAAVNDNHAPRSLGRDEGYRTVIVTGHDNGIIRLTDISKGLSQEPEGVIQLCLKDVMFDTYTESLQVQHVSCAYSSRQLIAGLGNGDTVICKYGKLGSSGGLSGLSQGPASYDECSVQHINGDAKLLNIRERVPQSFGISSTFLPSYVLHMDSPEPISCLKIRDIGFAAIAYKSGRLVVCDISRGPAVIFNSKSIREFVPSVTGDMYVTSLEFTIMEYGQDGYSSVILIAGTNCGGNLLYFKIVPLRSGGFEVVFADKTLGLSYKSHTEEEDTSGINQIIPINSATGERAGATLDKFQKLGQGILIPGIIAVASQRDVRVLKAPKTKLSHKVIDDVCLSSGVVKVRDQGVALATMTSSGTIKISTLPSLSEIGNIKPPKDTLKITNLGGAEAKHMSAFVVETGEIYIQKNKSEFIGMSVYSQSYNKHVKHKPVTDLLFNENMIIPPRPTASALSWAKGQTKYISTEDLNHLIAGPNRKPAKTQESQLAHNISPEANPSSGYGSYMSGEAFDSSEQLDKGYKKPVRRGKQSNYPKFGGNGFMRDLQTGIESVEDQLHGYATTMGDSVNDTYSSSKNSLYSGAVKSKFGL